MNKKQTKPKAQIIGADGNIFNLMSIASKALRKHGLNKDSKAMTSRIMESNSYEEALNILTEYIDPVDNEQILNDDYTFYDMEFK